MTKLPDSLLNNPLINIQIPTSNNLPNQSDLPDDDIDLPDDDVDLPDDDIDLPDSSDIGVCESPSSPSKSILTDENHQPSVNKIPNNIATSQIANNKRLAINLCKDLNLITQYVASLKCNHSSSHFFNSQISINHMNEMQQSCLKYRDFLVQQSNIHGLNLAPPNSTMRNSMPTITKTEAAFMIQTHADLQIRNVLGSKKVKSHNIPIPQPKKNETKNVKNLKNQLKNLKYKKKLAYHQDSTIQQQMRDDYEIIYHEKLDQLNELKNDKSVGIKLPKKRKLSSVDGVQNTKPKRQRVTRSNNSRRDGLNVG